MIIKCQLVISTNWVILSTVVKCRSAGYVMPEFSIDDIIEHVLSTRYLACLLSIVVALPAFPLADVFYRGCEGLLGNRLLDVTVSGCISNEPNAMSGFRYFGNTFTSHSHYYRYLKRAQALYRVFLEQWVKSDPPSTIGITNWSYWHLRPIYNSLDRSTIARACEIIAPVLSRDEGLDWLALPSFPLKKCLLKLCLHSITSLSHPMHS